MQKLPAWTFNVAALVLALGAGVMIGRPSPPSAAEGASSADSGDSLARTSLRDRSAPAAASTPSRRDSADRTRNGRDSGLEFAAILESISRLDCAQRLLAFLDRLPTEGLAAVHLEIANSPASDLLGSERSLILQAWAERDPMAVLAHLQDPENDASDWERETALGT